MENAEVPVKINVKMTIDEEEASELIVFGRAYQKAGSLFLQYEEVLEEGTVRTIVKVADEEALILRGGAVKMRLPFRLHKKLRGSYEMPFGSFETTTLTKRLKRTADHIDILYDFALNDQSAGTYHLEIRFQEE